VSFVERACGGGAVRLPLLGERSMVNLFHRVVSATFALGIAGALAGTWAGPVLAAPGPLAPAYEPSDQVCMTYYHQQSRSGASIASAGKACRGPDGYWRPAELGPSMQQNFSSVHPVNPAVAARSFHHPLMEDPMRTLNRRFLLSAGLGALALPVAAAPQAWGQLAAIGGCSLCQGAAFGGNAVSSSARIATSSGDAETDRFLGVALARLASTFRVSPGFAFFDDGNSPNAFASPETLVGNGPGTVLMGMRLFSHMMARRDGGITVIGICAHEFGHVHQMSSGYRGRLLALGQTVKPLELHADFLCGYYMALRKADHPDLDLRVLAREVHNGGDTATTNPQHHGTPEERLGALSAGFKFGIEGNRDIAQAADAGFRLITRSL
jgi:hypothetical protein